MNDIKPIETVYKGYRFRSRLEAKWAVFFDAMGIRYEYEYEGYERHFGNGETIKYLPDFYLPDSGLHAEVKGVDYRGQIPRRDAEKMSWMIDFNGPCAKGIVMLGNIPDPHGAIEWAIWRHDRKGIVWGYEWNDDPTGEWNIFQQIGGMESAPLYFQDNDDLVLTRSIEIQDKSRDKTRVYEALTKARQARFEHGETPRRISL